MRHIKELHYYSMKLTFVKFATSRKGCLKRFVLAFMLPGPFLLLGNTP